GYVCSDAREPCSDELSFCQRGHRGQRFRRDGRHIRGAFGAARIDLRERGNIETNEPIRGARLIFRSSIFARVGVNALVAFVALWAAVVTLAARDGSKQWIVLNNCRLIANAANDGDSFHVSAGEKEYIFRLYLVDAPETDEMTPGRLVEQANYFGISVP